MTTSPSAVVTPATANPDAAPAPARRRGRLLLLVAVGLLAAGGAGFFLLGGGGSGEASAAPVAGPVVDLEPMTLNLADGRFLKVGMALQLSAAGSEKKGEGEAALNGAKARDAAITVFGRRTYRELLTPAGRDAARKALDTEVQRRYPGAVAGVYLTEFVMQ